jgi:putative ABC transport system permease protein
MFSSTKLTFRNLWKTKGYSFLNIFGLALGISMASLIFLWVEDETQYNDYFKNKASLYEIKNEQTYEGITYMFISSPGPLAEAMVEDFNEVAATTRSTWSQRILFDREGKNLFQEGYYVDPSFVEMFSLQLLDGDPQKVLTDPLHVAISKSMAERFFGKTEVAGEVLRMAGVQDRVVAAVFEDLPNNVSFTFDWLLPFDNYFKENEWLTYWGNNGIRTFVQLKEGHTADQIKDRLYTFITDKSGNSQFNARLKLYPMERWRLWNSFDESGNEKEGIIKYVKLFVIIAWIILLIACINFMNLATARSQKRAKEIGVRKVAGAQRSRLIAQFLSESLWIALLAALFAVGITALLLPYFNQMVGKELNLGLNKPTHLFFLAGIVFICGLFAGSYPAIYLSSFNPIGVLKGVRIKGKGALLVRRGLVILQFTASICLIICTLLIYQQIQHVQNKDLGFNREGVLTTTAYPKLKEQYSALKNELLQAGLVEDMSMDRYAMMDLGSNTSDFTWEGKDPKSEILITINEVDSRFFSTHQIPMVKGRTFKEGLNLDSGNVVINRKLATLMGIEDDPIGKTIRRSWGIFTIIGMVDNFMISDVHSGEEPILFNPVENLGNTISMRIDASENASEKLTQIEVIFRKFNPEYPFTYTFLDDRFGQMLATETLIGTLTRSFSIIAVLISCLGLFGLAAFTAERRTKEIGIRKVLGASAQGLLQLLTKEFIMLVLISCLIAFPISYYMMEGWLDNYAYRIQISPKIFAFAGFLSLLIALITVSGQALRAALANPVKSIRNEP